MARAVVETRVVALAAEKLVSTLRVGDAQDTAGAQHQLASAPAQLDSSPANAAHYYGGRCPRMNAHNIVRARRARQSRGLKARRKLRASEARRK